MPSASNMKLGFLQNHFGSSPARSLDGSFRKSNSDFSAYSVSGVSASSKSVPMSRKLFKGLKDYRKELVDLELFVQCLEDWVSENSFSDELDPMNMEQSFPAPFEIDELQKLDLALEGVLLQQLWRLPRSPYAPNYTKEDEYLALEDFLHAIVKGLWRTFWHKSLPLPCFVSCPFRPGSKFYTIEKAISRGKLEELCGLALISRSERDSQVHWDQVMVFVLYKLDILAGDELRLSSRAICEALFYGFHILVSRSLGNSNTVNGDSVFVLVLDSNYGGVVMLGGDLGKLESTPSNPYQAAAEWIKNHSEICVSPVDKIWNKLGNPNWGDLGTLQIIMAIFYSFVQSNGPPRKSIDHLASGHHLRVQKRRMECGALENDRALVPYQPASNQGEIAEVEEQEVPSLRRHALHLEIKRGEMLLLDDQQQGPKSFQIQESLVGGNHFLYNAVSVDHPTELLSLYVGAHPSRLEPSWEDMSLWYLVQRQTKVLNTLKQQGVSSKYLPEIIASGRILHSGPCTKQSPGDRCDHPWCGTPVLVTRPVGEPLSSIVARNGPFAAKEAVRCCRDCLAALRSAAMANIQHGDISSENVIRVTDTHGSGVKLNILTSWGRAVLEDRDSPGINLQFSSSHALQHGKLCPSSDAESLVYLLYFICGGTMDPQDSIESALQWRERSWARRTIQTHLGEVSALLKAFADYVDGLCGTPYPVDYDIWLKRLSAAVDGSTDRGKKIEEAIT